MSYKITGALGPFEKTLRKIALDTPRENNLRPVSDPTSFKTKANLECPQTVVRRSAKNQRTTGGSISYPCLLSQ